MGLAIFDSGDDLLATFQRQPALDSAPLAHILDSVFLVCAALDTGSCEEPVAVLAVDKIQYDRQTIWPRTHLVRASAMDRAA